MTERNAPVVEPYTIGTGETLIYSPPGAPRDIPVSIFNAGDVIARIRFEGNDTYIPLGKAGMTCNPDTNIYATTDSGTTTVITATGVTTFASGVTSTGALTAAESQAIAAAYTQKSLLVEILLQAKLQTELLKLMADTNLEVSDFPNWRVPE